MGPHSLSAAVWELPPFMSLSPLCFWIFDCKDMCGDVLSVNSTARMKSNRKTCRAFSCEYQRSTLLVLVFQNLVLYNAVKQEQCLGFPSVLCQDKKQKFVFTKRSYKTVRAENSELSAADPVGCVFLGLPFSSCEISGEEYLNPVCRLI